jgi:exodeoxyribonuclease-1
LSNNLIFYDTETTGLIKDFAQILQCGSIKTNRVLEIQDEQNLGCAPLPWAIPHPMAMVTNKKTHLFQSNVSHYEMMRDLNRQWRQWTIDESAVFITFNGMSYDEELIRRQFYWNLFESYLTNTNGNSRLDILLMMHNVAAFFPDLLNIPLYKDGPAISLKQADIAEANGIEIGDAHDAIADCKLMISLLEIINNQKPELIDFFLSISSKPGVQAAVQQPGFLGLGEVFRREVFKYPVVPCGSMAPNDLMFFDLSFEPEEIFSLDTQDIYSMVQKPSKSGPFKKYGINKTIPLCPSDLIEDKNIFDTDFALLEERATQVRENTDFQALVSQAMADKINNWNNEYDHIEQMIYAGGFPSREDKELMADFHRIDSAEERIKICRNITDERHRLFAERLICQFYPQEAPEDMTSRYQHLIAERLTEEGPWGSMDKVVQETAKLLEKDNSEETQAILEETKEFLAQRSNLAV